MTVVSMNQAPIDSEYLTVYQRQNPVKEINYEHIDTKTESEVHGTPAFHHDHPSSFNNDSVEPNSVFDLGSQLNLLQQDTNFTF